MTEALSHVGRLAVAVAGVAQFVPGTALFLGVAGKRYPVMLGLADRPQGKPGPLSLIGLCLCTAVAVAACAILLGALGITTTYDDGLVPGGSSVSATMSR